MKITQGEKTITPLQACVITAALGGKKIVISPPPSIPCAQVLLNLYETGGSLRLASVLPIKGYHVGQCMTRLPWVWCWLKTFLGHHAYEREQRFKFSIKPLPKQTFFEAATESRLFLLQTNNR